MTAVVSVRPTGAVSVVDFDDGTSFRCTRDFVRRSQLSRGQQIDDIFIARLREAASYDLALSEAQRLNRRQRYSRKEIRGKLLGAGIDADAAERALSELDQSGELDDRLVAAQIARKGLRLLLGRDPYLTASDFRTVQTRRLLLRGFGLGAAAGACEQAWSEVHEGLLAPNC